MSKPFRPPTRPQPLTPAPPAQKVKPPTAPPIYRPQPVPKVLQRKAAAAPQARAAQTRPTPAAPPAYRPQPTPKVLQTKAAACQPPPARGLPCRPVAPPVRRTSAETAGARDAKALLVARGGIRITPGGGGGVPRAIQPKLPARPGNAPRRGEVVQRARHGNVIQMVKGQIFLKLLDGKTAAVETEIGDAVQTDDLLADVLHKLRHELRAPNLSLAPFSILYAGRDVLPGQTMALAKETTLHLRLRVGASMLQKPVEEPVDAALVDFARGSDETVLSSYLNTRCDEFELNRQQNLGAVLQAIRDNRALRVVLIDLGFLSNDAEQVVSFLERELGIKFKAQKLSVGGAVAVRHTFAGVEITYVRAELNQSTMAAIAKSPNARGCYNPSRLGRGISVQEFLEEERLAPAMAVGRELAEMYGWGEGTVREMAREGQFDEQVRRRQGRRDTPSYIA